MEQGIVSLCFEGRHVDRVVLCIETFNGAFALFEESVSWSSVIRLSHPNQFFCLHRAIAFVLIDFIGRLSAEAQLVDQQIGVSLSDVHISWQYIDGVDARTHDGRLIQV